MDMGFRVTPFAPTDAQLGVFEGVYTSPEIEGVYTLAVGHAGLVMQIPGRANINLQPVFSDAFAGAILGVVKFSRDARGAVTGFTANSDGARGLRFQRLRN